MYNYSYRNASLYGEQMLHYCNNLDKTSQICDLSIIEILGEDEHMSAKLILKEHTLYLLLWLARYFTGEQYMLNYNYLIYNHIRNTNWYNIVGKFILSLKKEFLSQDWIDLLLQVEFTMGTKSTK